jgi:hypothetical protein
VYLPETLEVESTMSESMDEQNDETIEAHDGWSVGREHMFARAREEGLFDHLPQRELAPAMSGDITAGFDVAPLMSYFLKLAVSPPRDPIPLGHAVIAVGAGKGHGQTVRRAIMRKLSTFASCYESVVLDDPLAAGDIHLQLEIARDGHIMSTSAYGFDESVATCVATAASALDLPRFDVEDHVHVRVPMTFRPYHAAVIRR